MMDFWLKELEGNKCVLYQLFAVICSGSNREQIHRPSKECLSILGSHPKEKANLSKWFPVGLQNE